LVAESFDATGATGGGIGLLHQQGGNQRGSVSGVHALAQKAPPFFIHVRCGLKFRIFGMFRHRLPLDRNQASSVNAADNS
jgi:hypothetical protein